MQDPNLRALFNRVDRLRRDLENQYASVNDAPEEDDDSGLYEEVPSMEPNDLPTSTAPESPGASVPTSSPRFLKRRSILSDEGSKEILETPASTLSNAFEIPADMSESEKQELADLLLQIQRVELGCNPELSIPHESRFPVFTGFLNLLRHSETPPTDKFDNAGRVLLHSCQ